MCGLSTLMCSGWWYMLPTRQTLASHTKTTLQAQSPGLLSLLVSNDPHSVNPSSSLRLYTSVHIGPPPWNASPSTPKSPMASCDYLPRSNDLPQNSKYLYSRPIQKLSFPPLNPPSLYPSASRGPHYFLPSRSHQ